MTHCDAVHGFYTTPLLKQILLLLFLISSLFLHRNFITVVHGDVFGCTDNNYKDWSSSLINNFQLHHPATRVWNKHRSLTKKRKENKVKKNIFNHLSYCSHQEFGFIKVTKESSKNKYIINNYKTRINNIQQQSNLDYSSSCVRYYYCSSLQYQQKITKKKTTQKSTVIMMGNNNDDNNNNDRNSNNNNNNTQQLLIPSQVFISDNTISTTSLLKSLIVNENKVLGTNKDVDSTISINDDDDILISTKRSYRRNRRNNKNKKKKKPPKDIIDLDQQANMIKELHLTKRLPNSATMTENPTDADKIKNDETNTIAANNEFHDTASTSTINNADNLTTTSAFVSLPPKLPLSFPITSGNIPDVYWRCIPMEHLRQHPKFISLPIPESIHYINTLNDIQTFRQDSWQWDMLHIGRCTTSQAVAALGFLEPLAAQYLGIPKSFRSHSRYNNKSYQAFIRLKQKPLRTLDEMNTILCNHHNNNNQKTNVAITETNNIWSVINSSLIEKTSIRDDDDHHHPQFAAKYNYQVTQKQMKQRKMEINNYISNAGSSNSLRIRMMWGTTQEATSLLTALNYFISNDTSFYMKETGMCGAGLSFNTSNANTTSSLLIGATPDAILYHSNGRIEPLEVKNHCPFYNNINSNSPKGKGSTTSSNSNKNTNNNKKQYTVREQGFDISYNDNDGTTSTASTAGSIFAHYIPQLMMEMLCLGDECQSAIMVRQTATMGALIVRIYRNDQWINEMLYWLQQFQIMFVNQNKVPTINFFYDNIKNHTEQTRYRRFLQHTLEVRKKNVEIVTYIPKEHIQRGTPSPLFLDSL